MVYRVYSEKKKELAHQAAALANELRLLLKIEGLENLRIINRYDLENISEELFETVKTTVLSEPPLDLIYPELPLSENEQAFAVEFLPGQFDQRADSAAQCIQLISQAEKPLVRYAKVYILQGDLSDREIQRIKNYVINPVEAREATLETYATLQTPRQTPPDIPIIDGFRDFSEEDLETFAKTRGLAMDTDDLLFCREYFKKEKRDPSLTEIRVIDTYWSDHCRHTTFLTTIDEVHFNDPLLEKTYQEYLETRASLNRTKPINLMDIATIAAKSLKQQGLLERLDESEEINACTVKIDVSGTAADGSKIDREKWLLLFKNETHNHPTEIEPFGGAATCIGGAIRDPLSGRGYVYAAMRVTGAADPLDMENTLPGKLPQRKITTTAADGYSSYGNQIGLATGEVAELYHPGYVAKRMEIGAVIAATPAKNVRREVPLPGDIVILLGGRTGRDGCGGATGSSKSHTLESVEESGAEVQKGNAPEERKLQRLFRNPEAARLIKRCNDFGAGGVSVAVGELADGLSINLDAVPKKYEGLDGTELAISESQERMAVVLAPQDEQKFIALADAENLQATKIAEVTAEPRLTMHWRDQTIVDLTREFLNSNGAEKHIVITPQNPQEFGKQIPQGTLKEKLQGLVCDLNVCSRRGLSEQFDSTIGSGTILMPFGGKYQETPIQAMAHLISMEKAESDICSLMAWGFNPYISEKSPYHGAYLAVVESVAKLIAAGASPKEIYLTFQEYFEKPLRDGSRWGKPLSALLGAFRAQLDLKIASIGGKDSMSGSFENLDVPPTLVSFAVTADPAEQIISPELKAADHRLVQLLPQYDQNGLPEKESLLYLFDFVHELILSKKALSVYTPGYGGVMEALFKMSLGNRIGLTLNDHVSDQELFAYSYGSFVLELADDVEIPLTLSQITLGQTGPRFELIRGAEKIDLFELKKLYEQKLESVFHYQVRESTDKIPNIHHEVRTPYISRTKAAEPRVLIPVFPGTNCEYDTAKAFSRAGADPEIFVIRNLTGQAIKDSVAAFSKEIRRSNIIFIPGGFSGGDEPEGSGKFITSFFRNEQIRKAVEELLEQRDGLMGGICNGFQALIKLGLLPYGKIKDSDSKSPTLTFNTISRHQSKIVRTKLISNKSPWLTEAELNAIYAVPISHGEGRFLADQDTLNQLIQNGQIITQYVDLEGKPSYQIDFNPNGSVYAVEGIVSPDGKILGKMGHSERTGRHLYKNVPGNYDLGLFRSAVKYFKG